MKKKKSCLNYEQRIKGKCGGNEEGGVIKSGSIAEHDNSEYLYPEQLQFGTRKLKVNFLIWNNFNVGYLLQTKVISKK